MGFSAGGGIQQTAPIATPPIEILTTGTSTSGIPLSAKGFHYALSAAGGSGGGGGDVCGGGGGDAGETVFGTIVFAELTALMGASIANLTIVQTLGSPGIIGQSGTPIGAAGLSGGDSTLKVRSIVAGIISEITIAIAKGGSGGMGGNQICGFGFGEWGTTFDANGGLGMMAVTNEHRSRDGPDRTATALNQYGNGGNGGAIGQPGSLGKPGYLSIEFY